MSFDIPGYFLDKKTNKLFKITPHGPYSLSELRKRVQREEEEEAAAALAPKLTTSQIPQPTNINQFLKQRASSPRVDSTMHYLMSHFKPRSAIQLDDSIQKFNNMLVETTQDNDYGEMFIASRLGLERFGYELDPQFHMWKSDGLRHNMVNTLSMQLLPKLVEHDGGIFRVLAGTSGGTLWSHQFQRLPPLISDEIKHMFTEDDDDTITQPSNILPIPVYSYSGYCNSRPGRKFEQKKDMFWSFSVNDPLDSVVVGGDQKIYHLNRQFNMKSCRKVKSSIFATHIPPSQPNVCWAGSRNGKISLMDWRQDRSSQEYLKHKYTQSSSIVKIHTLKNGFELLTVGLDGSIDIWDTRGKRKDQFSLKGHVNESNQFLGFDIDLENDLVMAAGSDGYVRIWSYANQCNDGKPIWTSRKYDSPIPSCKFKTTPHTYPRFQEGWESVMDAPARQCPGILLFGTTNNNQQASIEWLTSLK